jgi:hypothetical protein
MPARPEPEGFRKYSKKPEGILACRPECRNIQSLQKRDDAMRIHKILSYSTLLLILAAPAHNGVAGECDSPQALKTSRKSLSVDLQTMQANLRGFDAKINQAFDDAAKQNNWTPVYRAGLQKHVMLSKMYVDLEDEKKLQSQELRKGLGYFNDKTARANTADACLQRVKIKGIAARINALLDRQYEYVTQAIKSAKPR